MQLRMRGPFDGSLCSCACAGRSGGCCIESRMVGKRSHAARAVGFACMRWRMHKIRWLGTAQAELSPVLSSAAS